MKKRFTEEQIAYALRQNDSGITVKEIGRTMGVSQNTFYHWKKKYAGLGGKQVATLKVPGRRKSKPQKACC